MKPKETANRIMTIVQDSRVAEQRAGSGMALKIVNERLLRLSSELIASEPSYGHAARLHELTGLNVKIDPSIPPDTAIVKQGDKITGAIVNIGNQTPKPPMSSFAVTEEAAFLAARFISGKPGEVADTLAAMDKIDAINVALHLAAHLTPAKRALLVDSILGGIR